MNMPSAHPSIKYSGQCVRRACVIPTLGLVMCPWHEQFRNQRGPSRLVRGADAAANVTVKILVEGNAVLIIRIGLQRRLMTQYGALAVGVLQENARQAARQFRGHLIDVEEPPRSRRAFHGEVLAVVMMKLLQRFDDEEIERKPNRPAPIGIAAELPRFGFAR